MHPMTCIGHRVTVETKWGCFWLFLLLSFSGGGERHVNGEIQLQNIHSQDSLFRPLGKLPYFSCLKSLKQNAVKVVYCGVVHIGKDTSSRHGENANRKHLSEKKDKWTYQILPSGQHECRRSKQCLVPFSCFTSCSNVWVWKYSWVSEVFSAVAHGDWGIFCNGKQFVLFLNSYAFMFRYTLSVIPHWQLDDYWRLALGIVLFF